MIIVHFHIFKNGGTSFDAILSKYFGSQWRTFEGNSAVDVIDTPRFIAFLTANPQLKAISSHLARPPLPNPGDVPIVFLRDPIDRARSVYRFVASDKNQPNSKIAASGSFRRYVEWALDSQDGGVVIRDYQTIHLSAASFREPNIYLTRATEPDFQQARDLLRAWPAVGLVRNFSESLLWFEQVYGHLYPGLFTTEAWLNRTHPGFASNEAEWRLANDELGHRLFDQLIDANKFDLALYQETLLRLKEALV
jgi:hypothetical protein